MWSLGYQPENKHESPLRDKYSLGESEVSGLDEAKSFGDKQ